MQMFINWWELVKTQWDENWDEENLADSSKKQYKYEKKMSYNALYRVLATFSVNKLIKNRTYSVEKLVKKW